MLLYKRTNVRNVSLQMLKDRRTENKEECKVRIQTEMDRYEKLNILSYAAK